MRIATITLFCNEGFRLEAWKGYYAEYKDDVYLHVIVNNGDAADTETLKEAFPDSLVLESPTRNMMASYNLALRRILEDPDVDAVAQIVNDIRLSPGALSVLYGYLFSENDLFAVSPVLLEKDSERIDCCGCSINRRNLDFVHLDAGKKLSEVREGRRRVTGLPGGIFLAKRRYYERLGFQDERLEMYSDEVDMGIRVEAASLAMGATTEVRSWHQHVNRDGKVARNPRAAYLMGRNPVYIAKKYDSAGGVLRVFLRRVFRGLDEIRSAVMHGKTRDHYRFGWAMVRGAFAGLIGKR